MFFVWYDEVKYKEGEERYESFEEKKWRTEQKEKAYGLALDNFFLSMFCGGKQNDGEGSVPFRNQ